MDQVRKSPDSDPGEEARLENAPGPWRWDTRTGEMITPDGLAALLSVYAGQVSTYATLVWQVPALSLTGQSFLMTIVLGDGHRGPRFAAAVLSLIIAYASIALMHHHRGQQTNHVQMARRVTLALNLRGKLGVVHDHDAAPKGADALTAWEVDHHIYQLWKAIFAAFAITDLVIIYQVLRATWHVPAFVPVLAVAAGIAPILWLLGREAVEHFTG